MNTVNTKSNMAATTSPAIISVILFIVVLIALHFLEPEYDPSWHFISEYELGNFGWIMMVAFIMWGVSCAALGIALWAM